MIAVILPNLQGGGAERVALNLANDWAACGNQVEFVLMEARGEFLDFLHPAVSIHSLGCKRFRQIPFLLTNYLRQRQPEVTIVHMWPLTSIGVLAWYLAGKPGKLFVCEHTTLSYHVKCELSVPLLLVRGILRLTHRRATAVVAVSHGSAMDLASLAWMPLQRVDVIFNPVVAAGMLALPDRPNIKFRETFWGGTFRTHLLSVGSLKAVKNYRLLLRAFAKIAIDLDASLVILGDGLLRAVIEQDVKDLCLHGRVQLPGFHADPTPFYQSADLFVLSSDFEGFANVVVEALACGTPVVSTDCPHGPAEILEQGRYGELVPVGDVSALSDGIRRAFSRPWDREALQRRAQDFSIPKQAQAYLDLFYRP